MVDEPIHVHEEGSFIARIYLEGDPDAGRVEHVVEITHAYGRTLRIRYEELRMLQALMFALSLRGTDRRVLQGVIDQVIHWIKEVRLDQAGEPGRVYVAA